MSAPTVRGQGARHDFGQLVGPVLSTRFWRAVAFLVLSYPLGVLWFCTIITLILLSVSTLIIWVGVLVFAVTMLIWTTGARLERWRLVLFFGRHIASPYRPLPPGSLLSRAWARARDVAVWRDLLYVVLLFPLGIADLVIVVFGLAAPLGLIAMPAY